VSELLDIVCWKWKPRGEYRSHFGPETVNTLRRMVARNLTLPHRFSCITDDAKGIDADVRVIPLWTDHADVPSPAGPRNPSCYRRLKMFSAEARELIGERIVSLDLDTVVTGSLDPLFDRAEDFVIWGGQSLVMNGRVRSKPWCWYNGSFMMLRAGTRTKVWDQFDPKVSPRKAHMANARGSDQGWISYCLGTKEAVWTDKDGVRSFRSHIVPGGGKLPADTRMVAFHGRYDPWTAEAQRLAPWIREYYQ
jgi:hypothetical protein